MSQALLAQLYAGFAERYRDRIAPRHREVCERLVASFDAYLPPSDDGRSKGLVHGDYRLDNMLFGSRGGDRPLTVVDWQTVRLGAGDDRPRLFPGLRAARADAAEHADELMRVLPRGVGRQDAADARRRARRGAQAELLRGDDGDRVADARGRDRARRRDVHGDDRAPLRAGARHRRAGAAAGPCCAATVAAQPADEFAHQAGAEPMWNESWYCDFAEPAQGVGGWFRLGLTPNEGMAGSTRCCAGPVSRPSRYSTSGRRCPTTRTRCAPTHRLRPFDCVSRCRRYRVMLRGTRRGPRRSRRTAARRTRARGRREHGPGLVDGGHAVPVPSHVRATKSRARCRAASASTVRR